MCANGSRNCDTSVSQLPISKIGASGVPSSGTTDRAISACVCTSPMQITIAPLGRRISGTRQRDDRLGVGSGWSIEAGVSVALPDDLQATFAGGGFDLSAAVRALTEAYSAVAPAGPQIDVARLTQLADGISGTDPAARIRRRRRPGHRPRTGPRWARIRGRPDRLGHPGRTEPDRVRRRLRRPAHLAGDRADRQPAGGAAGRPVRGRHRGHRRAADRPRSAMRCACSPPARCRSSRPR